MSTTTLALSIETPSLETSSWNAFESLAVEMAKELPAQAVAQALDEA